MKVTCDRATLVEVLNLVGSVVVSRTPKPVLACVKLVAGESSLTVSGTDLEVALEIRTPRVEVSRPGEALVPCDKLGQIVRESSDSTLDLEAVQDVLHIRGADSHFQIFGHSPGDFPPFPQFSGEPDFEIDAGDLHKLITHTVFATARENSRYAINGVLMDRESNKLTLVATDGRRLALAKGGCQSSRNDNRSVIVPTKGLQTLMKLLTDPQQTVQVRMIDNQVVFATEQATLASNLVEGNFPPYKDVIPRDSDKKAVVDAAVLASAVRRAQLLTNEESKGVRFAFGEAGLTLTSRAPEMGEAEIKVGLEQYTGESVEIGFNPQFVLDPLKTSQVPQVTMEFKAANKPGILRTGSDFLYVVMPVNLQ